MINSDSQQPVQLCKTLENCIQVYPSIMNIIPNYVLQKLFFVQGGSSSIFGIYGIGLDVQ